MIELDVRELDHPLPLEMAVNAFKKLSGSEVIHMIHRREPLPLFEIITKNGGFYCSRQDDDQLWHIYITRDGNLDLAQYHV
ncbi:MAG TPA: DUF2249 domain-containing protein [Sulfuricurvum sp.]|nr:DUF2249 domain-containing protein [Sulfuricurvum sp.]